MLLASKINLRLGDALHLLESGKLPIPSIKDFEVLVHQWRNDPTPHHVLRLYAYLRKHGLAVQTTLLGNYLVPMLVSAGSITDAQRLFDQLPYRNEWSCYCLINGYVKSGKPKLALSVYQHMQKSCSASLSGHIFVALIKACTTLKNIEQGMRLHAHALHIGLLESNPYVGTSLVDMYAKCGYISTAEQVFDQLQFRDVVSWNSLIAGYNGHGLFVETVKCYHHQIMASGILASSPTFLCVLKACGILQMIDVGQEIHADIVKRSLLERDIVIGNTLIDMYVKCGLLTEAAMVFEKLPYRDIFSWNILIAGYADHGYSEKVLKCFQQMQGQGVNPDAFTLVSGLKACSSISDVGKGEEIQAEMERRCLFGRDLFVGSTLVDMYAKAGSLGKAAQAFERLPFRSVVSWTTLIAGYTEHYQGEEALRHFEMMQSEGITPNPVTYVWGLKACGNIGALDKGEELHTQIERCGIFNEDLVGNALVDMYVKCGSLTRAQYTFEKLLVRDVVSWTSIMAGYTQAGASQNVFHMFDKMRQDGISPNMVTFVVLLTACSRVGLVTKCLTFFDAMSKDYGLAPTLDHYACMVEVLSHSGQLQNAASVMPFHLSLVAYHSVLHACRNWGNVELGKWAFQHIVRLNDKDAAAYVSLSRLYAGVT